MKCPDKSFISVLVTLLLVGCASNRGIEAGNPDLKGKKLIMQLSDSTDLYLLKILEESSVVSQVKPDSFETISAGFSLDDGLFSLETAFADGTRFEVESAFDSMASLLDLRLSLNGLPVQVEFRAEDGELEVAEPDRVFLEIAAALCERIVLCNATFIQGECETEVLAVPGLSDDFGDSVSQTLAQAQAQVENGELVANVQPLESCIAGIDIVPCATVRKDFNDEEAPDFSRVQKIVPKPICAKGLLR
jgi:hypothetical protein